MMCGELILESPEHAYRWQLEDGSHVLGRSNQADLILPLPMVSRMQLRISCDETGCWVENLSRTNPTYLMGRPVTMPMRLRDGDLLGIGRLRLRFHARAPQTESILRGYLLIQQIGRCDRSVPLMGERLVVGRDPRSDVVLDYPAISRRHLLLEWRSPQGMTLIPLHPSPDAIPPVINGKTQSRPVPLVDGDEIWLGDGLGNGVTLLYRISLPLEGDDD